MRKHCSPQGRLFPPPPPPALISCILPSTQTQRLRQALQASQADRDTARLDKELLAQRLQGLEQEAENKKRSQDDRARQLKGLEVTAQGVVGEGRRWDFCGGRELDTPSPLSMLGTQSR